jgi:hypothetical protein
MDAFAMRRKVSVKGREKTEQVIVWETLRLRMLNNNEDVGKSAASKRVLKRL